MAAKVAIIATIAMGMMHQLTGKATLSYAIQRKLLTKEEAEEFIHDVRSMGSYPPIVDFDKYVCPKI